MGYEELHRGQDDERRRVSTKWSIERNLKYCHRERDHTILRGRKMPKYFVIMHVIYKGKLRGDTAWHTIEVSDLLFRRGSLKKWCIVCTARYRIHIEITTILFRRDSLKW